jgi:Aldehyde dehydrogenase family
MLVAIPFDDDAVPIAMANDSNFGLGSAICTRDVARAHLVAGQLETGMVWINDHHRLDASELRRRQLGRMDLSVLGGCRLRDGRPAAHHGRRQPRPDRLRGRIRRTVRRGAHPGIQRQDQTPSSVPRRGSASQPRPAHDCLHPACDLLENPGVPRPPRLRTVGPQRHPALPKVLPRPRGLQRPHQEKRRRPRTISSGLTTIGASGRFTPRSTDA